MIARHVHKEITTNKWLDLQTLVPLAALQNNKHQKSSSNGWLTQQINIICSSVWPTKLWILKEKVKVKIKKKTNLIKYSLV